MSDEKLFEKDNRGFLGPKDLDSFEWSVAKWPKLADTFDYDLSFGISDGHNMIEIADRLYDDPTGMLNVAKKLRVELQDFIVAIEMATQAKEEK